MNTKSLIGAATAGAVAIILAVSFAIPGESQRELRVAFFPNIGHAVPIVGLEKGFFYQNVGDNAKIETKLFESGPQVIEALFANSIDLAYVGPGPAINGYLKSENKIQIISGAASGGASLVIQQDSDIESAKDFAAKRIAAPQIGNTQDISLRHYLDKNGLESAEFGGSVFVINIPNPDIYTLFAKKDIDAAWVPEPWATMLVQELDGKRLFYEEDLWNDGQFASVLLVGRSDYIQGHPEIVGSWIAGHKKAIQWINENPEDARNIFNAFLKQELGRQLPQKIVDESLSNLEITSDPIRESIFAFAQRADKLGYLGRGGYSIDGIFSNMDSNSQVQEDWMKNDQT